MNERPTAEGLRAGVALFALLAVLLFGGATVGLAIAVIVAGATPLGMLVGFLVLPLCLGFGLAAWRAVVLAQLAGGLLRALVRSRGEAARFRESAIESARAMSASGMPATWVFVAVSIVTSGLAAALMALFAARDGGLAGILVLAAGLCYGLLLRRLARRGLLPMPEE